MPIPADHDVDSHYGGIAVASQAPPQGLFMMALAAGFIWGATVAFGNMLGQPALVYLSQGLGLAVAAAFTLLSVPGVWLHQVNSLPGAMIILHAMASVLSGVLNFTHPAAVARYVLLVPAMLIMLAMCVGGVASLRGMRAGLTLAGVAFVAHQWAFLDLSLMMNPEYRLSSFMNPNAIGFISAITGVSTVDYLLNRVLNKTQWLSLRTAGLVAVILACGALCVATKSRTASLVFLVATSVRCSLSLGVAGTLAVMLVGAVAGMGIGSAIVADFWTRLAEIFQLDDPRRSIATGTGRFSLWAWVVSDVWLPNFIVGVGPGQHVALIRVGYSNYYSSAHNGLLANLADVGTLGTLPLLVIIGSSITKALRFVREPTMYFPIAVLAGGLLESVPEITLFSIGNPGSLIFLLAIAMLHVPWSTTALHNATPTPRCS